VLLQGKHTRYTRNVVSKTHTVHHMASEAAFDVPAVPAAKAPPVDRPFEPNLNEMSQAVERRMRLREVLMHPGEADLYTCEMMPDAETSLRAIQAAGYEVVLVAVAVPWVAEVALRHLQMREIVGKSPKCPISEGNVLFCLEASEKAQLIKKMGGFVAAVERNWTICDSVLYANPDVHGILFNPDASNEAAFLQDLRVTQADAYALHELVQQYGTLQTELATDPHNEEHVRELQRLAPLIQQLHTKLTSSRSMVPAERLPPNTAAVLPSTMAAEFSQRPWLQVCDLLHVPPALAAQFESQPQPASGMGQSKPVHFTYPLAASDDDQTIRSLRAGEIPEGWEAIQDKETKDWFFVNHRAKTSSWLLPVHAADDREAAAWMQRSRRNEEDLLGDVGIGLTLARDAAGKVRVVAMQDDGPAQKSGRIKIDDIVLAIDGFKTDQDSEEQMVTRMTGRPNTAVVLRLQQGATMGGELGNKVPWTDLVTLSKPDPQAFNEETFIVHGMRLTVPVEDDQGVFTVLNVDTNEVVYRGPGKYKGVWDILCVEGSQVEGRPDVFSWRGELYKQPTYDARGIATVVNDKTNEVVYVGPGDSYVPGHPGNSAVVMPYVRIVRGHPRPKRGRVMVDLARVVLRLLPKSQEQVAAEGEARLVGCTLQLDCDYSTAMWQEAMIKRQLREDLAAALNVPVERFSTAQLERGSVKAKFNVVPGAGPSAEDLAKQVVDQAQGRSSALRSLPLGRSVVNGSLHRPVDPPPPCLPAGQDEAAEKAAVDRNIAANGLPHVLVHIISARSLPLLAGKREPDSFVQCRLAGEAASTKCVPANDAPTYAASLRLPLQVPTNPQIVTSARCGVVT